MHLTAIDSQGSLKYSNQQTQISTILQEPNEGFHIMLQWLAGYCTAPTQSCNKNKLWTSNTW